MERWGGVLQSLLLLSLWGLACGAQHDGCKDYRRQFERVFSVPGDVALLNSTLLDPSVFNVSTDPYNVTWYRLNSEQPISNQSGRVLVAGESLWFLNVTEADAGDYVTVVRTPQQCFTQVTQLVVDTPLQCGRPRTSIQRMHKAMNARLSCPLWDYTNKLRSYGVSYSLMWYKGCEQISDGTDRFHYWSSFLDVQKVESSDQALYTCTLRFSLGGVRGSVSETIDVEVIGDYYQLPQIREPAEDVIRAELGSNVTKRCLVSVPYEGNPHLVVEVDWLQQSNYVSDDPNKRVYAPRQRAEWQPGVVLIERWLVISELKEDDLNLNYTCEAWSGRGTPSSYFTLLQKGPELLVPVSLALGSCLLLFLLMVSLYHVFKLELVLWFRGTFPKLYSSSASDGKLYDAYVAYPQRSSMDWTHEVERFALQTLPQVLEKVCGYSLFIPDRDSLPGEAMMDSVEENLEVSRRIILLYTASTFSKKYCSNNNTLLSRPTDQTDTDHLNTSKDQLNLSKDHPNLSKDHLNSSKDHVNLSKDHLNSSKDHLNLSKNHLNLSKDQLHTSKDQVITSLNQLSTSKDHLNSSKKHLNSSKDHLNSSVDHLNTSMNHLNTSKNHLNTSKNHLNSSVDHLNTRKTDIITTNNNLNTTKDQMSSVKVQFSPSEDPSSDCQSCEDTCGHARTHLECVAAMHRALLERSMKVILVELEELGPSEVEQLPESVRHLRKTQGAVCWWRTRGTAWRTRCMRRTEDGETALSSCVSPDCRFWKEVRYRMPVKTKRTVPPETAALLNKTDSKTQRLNVLPV